MKVITLLNEKGGVGKTTLAVHVAAGLAIRGYRVVLVDADAQGHASLAVRAKPTNGFYEMISTDKHMREIVEAVPLPFYGGDPETPALFCVTGGSRTESLSSGIPILKLAQRMDELSQVFDFAIIDTSPSISDIHISCYIASDHIIYPTQCEYLPMQGLFKSMRHLRDSHDLIMEHGYKPAAPLCVIPNQFNGRESVQYQNLGYLQGKLGSEFVFPQIRHLTALKQASQMRLPIMMYSPRSEAAKDVNIVVEMIMEKLGVVYA